MVFVSCAAHTAFHNGNQIICLQDGTFDAVFKPNNTCSICGKQIAHTSTLCPDCMHKKREIADWPDDKILAELVTKYSLLSLAKHFHVSANAIKHRCRHHNISIPKGKKAIY